MKKGTRTPRRSINTNVLNKDLDEIFDEMKVRLKKTYSEEVKKATMKNDDDMSKAMKEKAEEMKMELVEKTKELEKLEAKLEAERSELEDLEATNSALVTLHRQSNDENVEAHKELIRVFRDLSDNESNIKIKKMGEIDEIPFKKICKERLDGKEAAAKCAMIISKWQEKVADSSWHPFKRVGSGERMKEIVDREDDDLKNLREEYGVDVYNAVRNALEESNECNGSGRYSTSMLWNYEFGRKASIKEGISHMMQHIKILKRKRS